MLKMMLTAAVACVLMPPGAVHAQQWPTRPVTMVVGFAAGGTTDLLGRIVAQRVGEVLGQPIVVENVGGAGGVVGSLRIAQAKPDGSQVLFGGLGTLVLNQMLYKKPPYDTLADFVPVALVAEVPLVLLTRKTLPVNSLQEFIAYAKANAADMTFGSAGVGSAPHFGCLLLNMAIGADITHVPYRGSGPALQELSAGRIDYYCDALPSALPHIEAKSISAIAILAPNRAPVLPDLPTAQQQGLANFEAYTWFGFFFPRGTSDAIVHRLQGATVEAMKTPSVRERLEKLGATVVPPDHMTPEHLGKLVRSEMKKWAAPIKASGVSAD
jgi:tripartite-type tricarboxylate transporter receptor subunit TctC